MSRGHSLLELLAVLAVLAMLAGIVALAVRPSPDRPLREARNELGRTLAAGRDLARTEGCPQFLVLRPGESAWWLEGSDGTPAEGFRGRLPEGHRFRTAWTEPGRAIRTGPVRLRLPPEGDHAGLVLEIRNRKQPGRTWGIPSGSWNLVERTPEIDPELEEWFRRWL